MQSTHESGIPLLMLYSIDCNQVTISIFTQGENIIQTRRGLYLLFPSLPAELIHSSTAAKSQLLLKYEQ